MTIQAQLSSKMLFSASMCEYNGISSLSTEIGSKSFDYIFIFINNLLQRYSFSYPAFDTPKRNAWVLLTTRSCNLHFNTSKPSSSDFIPKICGNLKLAQSSRLPHDVIPQRGKSSIGTFSTRRTPTKWNWQRGSIKSKSIIGKFSIKLWTAIFALK